MRKENDISWNKPRALARLDARELPLKMLRRARSMMRYLSAFPPSTAFRLIRSKLKLRKSLSGELVEFRVLDRICPALRAKTHDIDIFEQIFIDRDCEVKLQIEPRFIVDAGHISDAQHYSSYHPFRTPM
jgi:hypothetical protein